MTAYALENLYVTRNQWEKNAPLRAKVKFKGAAGTIEIDLGPDVSAAILAVVADQIVAAATMRADEMKAAFVEGSSQALISGEVA